MSKTIGRISRAGTIHFSDAHLGIWEEGLNPSMTWEQRKAWELQFKRDVFARIVQTMNRLGWKLKVCTEHERLYGRKFAENFRECAKGDLRGELSISARHIKLEMWQGINTPTRPDHGGRYESNKEACAPYLLRLEMQRTRNRICQYLLNVFTGYEFVPPKLSSPNPDPLAYFNSGWDGDYERKRGTHRFHRGADGWPSDKELGSWDRKDRDGAVLQHGAVRCMRDSSGRLMRGRVYGGINGMWMFVYGPGQRDFTHRHAKTFFTYHPGETPAKLVEPEQHKKRLEQALAKAVEAMDFQRAHVLKGVLIGQGLMAPAKQPAEERAAA